MPKQTSIVDVFINCPFDDGYSEIFRALIFALRACGFRPRTALEVDDGGQARIEKLIAIIRECRYGIHDISRTQLDRKTRLPRFNMPFKLGIFLGAKRFGNLAQKEKRLLILDEEKYRYQKFISDLAGMDIHSHANSSKQAISEMRDWLANVSRRQLEFGDKLNRLHSKFQKELPAAAKELGLKVNKISYADYDRLVSGWLSPQ